MTKKQITQGITLDNVRSLLPFIILLVSLVLAWASLNSYLSLLSARVDSINERVGGIGTQLNEVGKETRETKEEVIRLSVIIEGAQTRGQISQRPSNLAFVPEPTPFRESEITIHNQTHSSGQMESEESKTEPTPTIIQNIIELVGGIL